MEDKPSGGEPSKPSDITAPAASGTAGQSNEHGGAPEPLPNAPDDAMTGAMNATCATHRAVAEHKNDCDNDPDDAESGLKGEANRELDAPWRLWLALAAFIPVADFCLYGVQHWGVGLAVSFAWLSLLAVFVSRGRGRVALGIAILLPTLAATLIEPGFANVVCLLAGLSVLAWSPRRSALAWGLLESGWRSLRSLSLFIRYSSFGISELNRKNTVHTFGEKVAVIGGKGRKALRLVLPALCVSLFFLFLLALGNVALGKWVLTAAQWVTECLGHVFEWLSGLFRLDIKHISFWACAFIAAIFLLMPAQSHRLAAKGDGVLCQSRPANSETGLRSLQWLLVLAGVNLVFLLTNTLDAVYLWVRQSPPEGVNTTEYLYGGVNALVLATLLAGGLLAVLFNREGGHRYRRTLRWMGILWIAQNIFLIGGVGFRLWLHVERFCLTPRRVEVAFFLLLVLAGFVLLLIYVIRSKSLQWLVGNNLLALLLLFFGIQFVDINGMCVQSALDKRKVNRELVIDGPFLKSVGLSGWPLVHELALERDEKAREVWLQFKAELPFRPRPLMWQAYSARRNAQILALCQSAGVAEQDIGNAWERALRTVY